MQNAIEAVRDGDLHFVTIAKALETDLETARSAIAEGLRRVIGTLEARIQSSPNDARWFVEQIRSFGETLKELEGGVVAHLRGFFSDRYGMYIPLDARQNTEYFRSTGELE